jgi:hypothetical protein
MAIVKRYPEKDEAFLRSLMFPEEDRHRYIRAPWDGSFRWFRASNVICLEHYRRAPDPAEPKTKPAA